MHSNFGPIFAFVILLNIFEQGAASVHPAKNSHYVGSSKYEVELLRCMQELRELKEKNSPQHGEIDTYEVSYQPNQMPSIHYEKLHISDIIYPLNLQTQPGYSTRNYELSDWTDAFLVKKVKLKLERPKERYQSTKDKGKLDLKKKDEGGYSFNAKIEEEKKKSEVKKGEEASPKNGTKEWEHPKNEVEKLKIEEKIEKVSKVETEPKYEEKKEQKEEEEERKRENYEEEVHRKEEYEKEKEEEELKYEGGEGGGGGVSSEEVEGREHHPKYSSENVYNNEQPSQHEHDERYESGEHDRNSNEAASAYEQRSSFEDVVHHFEEGEEGEKELYKSKSREESEEHGKGEEEENYQNHQSDSHFEGFENLLALLPSHKLQPEGIGEAASTHAQNALQAPQTGEAIHNENDEIQVVPAAQPDSQQLAPQLPLQEPEPTQQQQPSLSTQTSISSPSSPSTSSSSPFTSTSSTSPPPQQQQQIEAISQVEKNEDQQPNPPSSIPQPHNGTFQCHFVAVASCSSRSKCNKTGETRDCSLPPNTVDMIFDGASQNCRPIMGVPECEKEPFCAQKPAGWTLVGGPCTRVAYLCGMESEREKLLCSGENQIVNPSKASECVERQNVAEC